MNLKSCISASSLLIAAGLFCTSCAKEKDTVVGTPPPEEFVQQADRTTNIKLATAEKKKKTNYPEPVFTATGWPYQESDVSFRLTWDSSKTTLPLLDAPSFNGSIVGKGTWSKGEELIWTNSSVGVYEPSAYRVKTPFILEGQLYSDGYRTGDEYFSEELRKGARVDLFHYATKGMCYLGVSGKIIEGSCPSEDRYTGNFEGADNAQKFQPKRRQWWVHVNAPSGAASGWMPLDDRVIVDILR